MAPSRFLLQGGVIKSRLAEISYKEHRTGYSYTGPPYFIRERPITKTVTTTNVSTTITDMYETEVIEYKVDDRSMQTEVPRADMSTPLPPPPLVSHYEIPFDLFDTVILRPNEAEIHDTADAFAREVVAHRFFQYEMNEYRKVIRRIAWDSPMRRTHGMEPRGVMMEMFNLVYQLRTKELQTSPNAPPLMTPMHWKYTWNVDPSFEGVPTLTPCVATRLENGIRDLDHWEHTIVFVDVRPGVGYSSEAHAAELDAQGPNDGNGGDDEAGPSEPAPVDKKGKGKARASTPSGRGRKRAGSETPGSHPSPSKPSKRLRPIREDPRPTSPPPGGHSAPIPVEDDKWMTRYATEMMSALGNRRFGLGILIEGWLVRFYYFDRAGSIRSSAIDMKAEPERVIAAIINLELLDAFQLGLQPMVSPDPKKSKNNLHREIRDCEISVDGVRYRVANALQVERNLYGRGTTYWTAFTERPPPLGPDLVLDDPDVSDKQRAAERRALERKHARWAKIPDGVTLKLSWQVVSDKPDDDLYARAGKRGVNDIVVLHGSRVAGRLSDGPREKLMGRELYADRVLRVQVFSPICEPVWGLASQVDRFKAAILGCLKTHYELYSKSGIIHRNVCPDTLAVDGPGQGMIVDLTYAMGIDGLSLRADKNVPSLPLPTVGTPSFAAIDVHIPPASASTPTPNSPAAKEEKYLYRNDLESFVYSLAYIVSHYQVGRAVWSTQFSAWSSGSSYNIAESKRAFLRSCAAGEFSFGVGVESAATKEWLPKLCRMFDEAYTARDDALEAGEEFDDETMGGRITYETFLAAFESEMEDEE